MEIIAPKIPGYQLNDLIYQSDRTLVYRGKRTDDHQLIVIKLMRNEYPTFNELVQFRNQYAITQNLNISGVIQPYALERYENRYVLIMEDFGGVSLDQRIGKSQKLRKSLSLIHFFPIAIQLTEILHQLHQQRIIHKDIKPANILIHPETKQVKLIDFSISSLLPKETQAIQTPNFLEGTLAYLSPEQTGRMNRGIDYRSDFYSLGITCYELLSGRLPFESEDPMELVHSHLTKMPGSLNLKTQLQEGLERVVMKLIAKNAEERYQSAIGLKYDLEKCFTQWQENGIIESFELGERDICDRFMLPEKLYGRENEVTKLLEAYERITNGNAELMLVAGFSGIGKTAIVNEVHKPIIKQRGYFIKGKFDQFNRNIPFDAFVQAFRDLMQQLLSENDAQLQIWRNKIIGALGDNGQVIIEVIPELERIIGKQLIVTELSGTAAQNRFNLLFQKFIQVFTTPEHPLTMFLDDLQWADSGSLNLIKLLISESKTGYLLLIGAYRDNEVYPAHPLMLILDEVAQFSAIVNTLTLQPLSQTSLNHLVADTLNCTQILAQPLTDLVYQKTGGNPFFATQFLKALNQDELIKFNPQTGYWQCDIVGVRAAALTDDVVEFMGLQLQKLPSETQAVIKLAACIGNQFDLNTLAIVSKRSPAETATDLWAALAEGLILPQSEVYKFYQNSDTPLLPITNSLLPSYKFLHDRVQQAAYSLIAETEKQVTHLYIGTLLLENLSVIEREERIFEIVNHLNIGNTLITDPNQKQELARLNLLAGIKAKASTAYAGAFTYITAGMELLPADCWENHYDLSFAFFKERAEIEYLNGNFAHAAYWLQQTVEKAKTPLEKAEVYNMSIVQYTLQAKYPEAIKAGREALALINIDLPESNLDQVRDAELAIAEATLKNRSFLVLGDLPMMTEPEQKMAIKLLISMGPPTYRSHQRLWSVICAKAVNLCWQYGNTPEIGYIYPAFGGLRGYALNNYQGTSDLLDVTLQLMPAFNNKSALSVAYLMIGSSLRHWSHPLKVATEDYLSSYQVGLESSNLQYAAYAFGHNMYCRFYQSVRLKKLFNEITESLAFSQKYKNQWAIDLFIGGQIIISELMGTHFETSEPEYLEQCRQHKNSQVICIYNILKSQSLFFFERLDEALDYGRQAETEIVNVAPQGLLTYVHHCFIYALLLIAHYPKIADHQKSESWEKISTYQQQLTIWAENCPANFRHLSCLVKAEMARISGNLLEAIEFYDLAISEAKANEHIQEAALANELAAKFYLNWGKEKVAAGYMQEAYYCYALWGAEAKTDDLAKRYPQLLQPILQSSTNLSLSPHFTHSISQTGSSSSILDLSTAIKASQAISREVELESLLSKLMKIVLENAGADLGILILNNSENWEVVAHCTAEGCNLSSMFLDQNENLPHSIINVVKNSEQNILINEVEKDITLANDPYFLSQHPQSLFCLPILNQSKLVAILYLENNLTVGAFTEARVEVLNLLISQAAISIENAQLYNTLEQKVVERTAQLSQTLETLKTTQKQLVESEKMAALGGLVAGVAHEINTPIGTSITLASTLADETKIFSQAVATGQIKRSLINNYLEVAETSTQLMLANLHRAGKLIQSFKQIATGQENLERQKFNLKLYLEEISMSLAPKLKQTPHTLIVVGDENIIIDSYAGALAQIMTNLVINSLTHAYPKEEAGQLRFDIHREGEQVKIVYSDDGSGIEAANLGKIFEPFFTTARHRGGTGLGLNIVYNLVTQKLQGTISVHSEVGLGTQFMITLPHSVH
jgi:predicted ATPase/signal transduction histidine kinase